MIRFYANPVDKVRITSAYGFRKHPITGEKTFHYGIDLGKEKIAGEPIFAVADGQVVASHFNKARGYLVIIQHNGFASLYQHLERLGAQLGRTVRHGEEIGKMGNTGASAGVHLHFEIYDGDYAAKRNVDPAPFLLTEAELRKIKEEESELIEKIKVEINGRIVEVDAIKKDGGGRNFVELRDLADVLDVSFDPVRKIPIIKSK